MSGRGASACSTQTLGAQQRLHLLNSASSVTAEEHTKQKKLQVSHSLIYSFVLQVLSYPELSLASRQTEQRGALYILRICSGQFKPCECRINVIVMMAKITSGQYHSKRRKNPEKPKHLLIRREIK